MAGPSPGDSVRLGVERCSSRRVVPHLTPDWKFGCTDEQVPTFLRSPGLLWVVMSVHQEGVPAIGGPQDQLQDAIDLDVAILDVPRRIEEQDA